MNVFDIKNRLEANDVESTEAFGLLQAVCALTSEHDENAPVLQELVLLVLNKRNLFVQYEQIVNSLVRKVGLFPYLIQEDLCVTDAVANELHKFKTERLNVTFHRQQLEIFSALEAGENIVLSAPTSFGKSLIIEAVIAQGDFDNIVVLLPTIALVDEMRRSFYKYSSKYKLITHNAQTVGAKNIFLFTQERFMENDNITKVDFFVIDEFYKLNPNATDGASSRCYTLNQAFYRLLKSSSRFYLLGPNIDGVNFELPDGLQHRFFRTDFKTVATNFYVVPERVANRKENKGNRLRHLCSNIAGSTLIYCSSPSAASGVAAIVAESSTLSGLNAEFADWLSYTYHPSWVLAESVTKGVGLHHGKLPRAITQFVMRKFNADDSTLQYLVCTSTMIEGVNTKAKNIVLYDNRIGRDKLDFFTFSNICGRSGRMLKHFVGNVYLFHPAPNKELPFVDPPILSQTATTSPSLLIELDGSDSTQATKNRLETYANNPHLPLYILKKNSRFDFELQIALAKDIETGVTGWHDSLSWTGVPENDQLITTCRLLLSYGFLTLRMAAGFNSIETLVAMVWQFKSAGSIKQFINFRTRDLNDKKAINKEIDKCLDFIRNTLGYVLPNALKALDMIQNHVFQRLGKTPGSYGYFSQSLEHQFKDQIFTIFDEYGLPMEIAEKIIDGIIPYESIDDALGKLSSINADDYQLSAFEKAWVKDVQKHL